MTQKEKYEILDKELRPKYEHLSDDEYQKVRAQYIKSQSRKIHLKFIFRGLVIPWGVGILLLVALLAFTGGNVPSFVTLLWSIAIIIWTGVELYRWHVERDKLPEVNAGLRISELTSKRISRDIGGYGLIALILIFLSSLLMFAPDGDSFARVWIIAAPVLLLLGIGSDIHRRRMWKTGKYRLVARKAVRKDYAWGDSETGNTYWLCFDNPGGKVIERHVSEAVYDDMKMGDLYYLVLKKKFNGGEKVLLYYKAEQTTLDDELKAILQK